MKNTAAKNVARKPNSVARKITNVETYVMRTVIFAWSTDSVFCPVVIKLQHPAI